MPDTLMDAGANGAGPGHDTGFAFSPLQRTALQGPVCDAPGLVELKHEIAICVAADPAPAPGDAELLALMGQHDAAFGAALAKLPDREGTGGAVLAALVKKYRGGIDALQTARLVSATLIFAPDAVPGDERVGDAVLRLADFCLDAAKELARAYIFLGPRFTLDYSLRVLLDKYNIAPDQYRAGSNVPADAFTPAGLESMLAQGQLDLVNEMLRPFEITIRQKIGTVNPVYSLIDKNNGRAVMPARDLIEFLRKSNVFA
jgi:hypothetical protein